MINGVHADPTPPEKVVSGRLPEHVGHEGLYSAGVDRNIGSTDNDISLLYALVFVFLKTESLCIHVLVIVPI